MQRSKVGAVKPKRPALVLLCLAFAFIQGWILLEFHAGGVAGVAQLVLLYLGILGSIPFLLINGAHGDPNALRGVAGGVLYVLTNATAYFYLIAGCRRFLRKVG